MAWCENCNKTSLRKEDVEFCESTKKILCHGCYVLAHPGWVPPLEFIDTTKQDSTEIFSDISYTISIDSKEGFRTSVSYKDLSLNFHVPLERIKQYLGS